MPRKFWRDRIEDRKSDGLRVGDAEGQLPAGQTFLVVDVNDQTIVAADQVGAGVGDHVLLATGTVASRYCMDAPVDAAVVAILDPKGMKQ